MAKVRNEEHAAVGLHVLAQVHGFGSSRGLIEQRRVGDIQPSQLGGHGLEIQQSLQTTLGNLCLVGSVLSVPTGVFQNITLDDRRGDAVGIPHADEGAEHLVLGGDGAQFIQHRMLAPARRQVEGLLQADLLRHDFADKRLQGLESERCQHLDRLFRSGANVAADEIVDGRKRLRASPGC